MDSGISTLKDMTTCLDMGRAIPFNSVPEPDDFQRFLRTYMSLTIILVPIIILTTQ